MNKKVSSEKGFDDYVSQDKDRNGVIENELKHLVGFLIRLGFYNI